MCGVRCAVRVGSPPCCCLCPLFSHTLGLSQSDGGYLGSDFQAFFSAVVSGAAGVYIGMLVEDAGISTDLTIRPGQDVRISGDPGLAVAPRWGSGGFTVQERGSLFLAYISLDPATVLAATEKEELLQLELSEHFVDLGDRRRVAERRVDRATF